LDACDAFGASEAPVRIASVTFDLIGCGVRRALRPSRLDRTSLGIEDASMQL
jgi:hypothetical protein